MPAGGLDVLVRFIGDSTKLRSEVDKAQGTGGKMKSWAKGVGAAVAGAFAVTQIKEFINQAAELQDTIGASEVVFEGAAKGVQAWAKGAADAFGMSTQAALESANQVAAFGKGAGLSGNELAKFSEGLVGLAGDLASFKGGKPEDAMLAIQSALQGEAEPMRRFGVLLNEGAIKSRALSMGLVKATGDTDKIKRAQLTAQRALVAYSKAVKAHGKNSQEATQAGQAYELAASGVAKAVKGTVPELTAQQKVLATQAEIFAQTSDAQGDFARTSDSAANQQKKLAADMANTKAAIGTALLPVLQKILPYLQDMATFVEKNAAVIVPLVAAIGAFVVVMKIATLVTQLFGISLGAAFIWVVVVIAAIAALIAIGVLIVKNWDTIKAAAAAVWDAMQAAWSAILDAVKAAFNWIKDNWPLLLAILTGPIGIAVALIVKNWDKILSVLRGVWEWIKRNWPLLVAILTGPIGVAVLAIVKNWDRIKAAVSSAFSFIKGVWSGILAVLRAPFDSAASAIKNVIDGIRSAISSAYNFIADVVGRAKNVVSSMFDAARGVGEHIADMIRGPINVMIRGFNKIPFVPNIPELAKGGLVTQTGLAVVHQGEVFSGVNGEVFSNVSSSSAPTIWIDSVQVRETLDVDAFMRRLAWTAQQERI
jgi:hypothetical protein